MREPVRISDRAYVVLALAVTPDGAAHAVGVIWRESEGLFYLTNAGGEWSEEQLPTPPLRGADVRPAIDVDSDGTVHVVYSWCQLDCPDDPLLNGAYHLTRQSGAWSEAERLPDGVSAGSLRVDNGTLHLAYSTSAGDTIPAYYSTNAGGSWSTTELAADGDIIGLELDGSGTAYVVFEEFSQARTASQLYLATATPGAAPSRQPLTGLPLPDPTYALLFDMDGAGRLHFAFYGDEEGSQYVLGSPGSWSEPVAMFEPVPVDYGDDDIGELRPFVGGIAVDRDGSVHAVSQDNGGGGAYVYATNRSGTFQSEQLLPLTTWDDAPPPPVAIDLDAAGRPHMIFVGFGEDGGDLWYTTAD